MANNQTTGSATGNGAIIDKEETRTMEGQATQTQPKSELDLALERMLEQSKKQSNEAADGVKKAVITAIEANANEHKATRDLNVAEHIKTNSIILRATKALHGGLSVFAIGFGVILAICVAIWVNKLCGSLASPFGLLVAIGFGAATFLAYLAIATYVKTHFEIRRLTNEKPAADDKPAAKPVDKPAATKPQPKSDDNNETESA
ncbi:hypothetical protein FWF89_03310 [Candidatus Saccharibacteria bacterium]|nr:hypothetical protein [Candidatus Saccharibacteria bacterium]